jgi:hypothetical protein
VIQPIAPFAWVIGGRAVEEIDASGGACTGRTEAYIGKILGIVGTVLLVVFVVFLVGFLVLVLSTGGFDSGSGTSV